MTLSIMMENLLVQEITNPLEQDLAKRQGSQKADCSVSVCIEPKVYIQKSKLEYHNSP